MAEADPRLDELADTFDLLGDWEERYRYVIELGRGLEPLPEAARTDATKVSGCASQVWLLARTNADGKMSWLGDSDAHIVRGLIAILLDLYSGRTPQEVLDFDAKGAIQRLGLSEALSSQRSNGLNAMIQRIRADAAHASR
ncbi:SufE family protein [Brevundimonas sp.]|uniref:SufE family protein n=1 Tax=Brevundimonas sp. TaxID=1871086 RepID=UPI0025F4F982|nr:SufE family protein [Brevundimonas sp.]